jgi:parvulin-like peptidyl-prolyl isomerase
MFRFDLLTIAISALLTASALLIAGSQASAQIVIPTNRNTSLQQGQLQQLQNSLQRQQYQQQQQLYRELDRQAVPKPQPNVPVFTPTCRADAVGNAISRVCR